jgi:hypothetical protein
MTEGGWIYSDADSLIGGRLAEEVVYDNERGEDDDAEPTVIGGGSIVIHKN